MSVSIPKELQDFITGKVAWVATSDSSGMPNLAPKGSLQVMDEHTLAFADVFSKKTKKALEENPKVAVAVIDLEKSAAYQFKGEAKYVTSGPIFDKLKARLAEVAPHIPGFKEAVKIVVTGIYDLTPGPNAGKKLG